MTLTGLEHPMDSGLKTAVKAAGGVRSLARKIGVSHVAVLHWKMIPVARLFAIEKVTGVPREQLRPDIFLVPRPKKKTIAKMREPVS